MKLKKVELFKNRPVVRYSIVALIVLALAFIIIADRNSWFHQWFGAAHADITIDCPELEKGCAFKLNDRAITVKSDIPLEVGKPFKLTVEGDIITARAVWRMIKMDMGPNNYKLIHDDANRWYASVTLPPCPHGGKEWQLHLELNARAADINTRIRDDKATMLHSMGEQKTEQKALDTPTPHQHNSGLSAAGQSKKRE